MINLSIEDNQQLINILQRIPQLISERERPSLLIATGLGDFLPRLDISGSAFAAVNQIVNVFSNYGRLRNGQEALGIFLNGIIEGQLVGEEQQAFLGYLLTKYHMMIPIKPSLPIIDWISNITDKTLFEKIIGENTLRPISFLAQGLKVSRSVAYIRSVDLKTREPHTATGFLIAPDLLMTNNHVIEGSECLPDTIVRFNYEETFQGNALPISEYRVVVNGLFHTNKELDYTIIQLDQNPGNEWGWLPIRSHHTKIGKRINIIQHPNGLPKSVSLQNNIVAYVGGSVIQYLTSTLPGSSGSPVLNDQWEVVALHHAGGSIEEPTTGEFHYRNEGIQISQILANLPIGLRQHIEAARNS